MLGREPRSQGRDGPVLFAPCPALFEEPLQDEENRDAGDVSVPPQNLSRKIEAAQLEPERLLVGLENLRPAGMDHEVPEVSQLEPVSLAGFFQRQPRPRTDYLRHALGEADLEPRLDQIPAHDVLGIGPGRAVAPQYLRVLVARPNQEIGRA